jgi:hypothetical protein
MNILHRSPPQIVAALRLRLITQTLAVAFVCDFTVYMAPPCLFLLHQDSVRCAESACMVGSMAHGFLVAVDEMTGTFQDFACPDSEQLF